jgi:ribosome-associated protein
MQDDDFQPWDEPPSKSSRKREMTALQELGERLANSSPAFIAGCDLPQNLVDALTEFARLPNKHGARRRQLQYIGKLMRGLEPETVDRIRARFERNT